MTRCAEKIYSVSLETSFNETWKGWMDNLDEEYEALYQFISGQMRKDEYDLPYSQEWKDYAKADGNRLGELWKKRFPEHMHDTVRYFCRNTSAGGSFVPYVIEELHRRGLLSELPGKRKKSVMNVAAINGEAFEALKE
jgi:hypothetical protein